MDSYRELLQPGWSKGGGNPTFPLEVRLPSKAASPRERGSVGVLRACRQSPRLLDSVQEELL